MAARGSTRVLVIVASFVLAVVGADLLFRFFGPQPYLRPRIRDASGNTVDMGQIIGFFREGRGDVPDEPTNGIHPGFRGWFCYDRPEWDYFDENGCVEVRINALGFRDDEFPLEKPPGERRLLAIGDSFTFGQGVRAEDTWPQVLERMLGEAEGTPVQVMNAGFTGGGSWPLEYRPWIEAHALAFEPETVVYGMCLNDMDRKVPMLAYVKVWNEESVGDPWLWGLSAILSKIQRDRWQRLAREHRPLDMGEILRITPENWRANREALRAIHDHLAEHGVRFVLAVFPMLSLLGENYPYTELHGAVRAFCEEEGIEHLDLYDRFRDLTDRDLWVHPFDQHPNDVAQRLFAEGILEHLTGGR